MTAHALGDGRVLRDQVADPQAGQPPGLGEGAQHRDVGPLPVDRHRVGHVGVEAGVEEVEQQARRPRLPRLGLGHRWRQSAFPL